MTGQTIAVVDLETTGLVEGDGLERHRAYEGGFILRWPDGHDTEHHWWLDLDDLAHLDLSPDGPNAKALSVGRFWERHPQWLAYQAGEPMVSRDWAALGVHREATLARNVARMLDGRALAGINVGGFDAPFLDAMLRRHGLTPTWSYRHTEIGTAAAIALGLAVSPGLDDLLAAYAIEVDPAERHTALGDARVEARLLDAARQRVADLRRTDARTAALARILTDLDRCPHGRHRIDSCLSCPGGQSLGNPHMRPGAVVGYDLGGEPYTAPWSDRPDPLCSTSEPDAWRPRPEPGEATG